MIRLGAKALCRYPELVCHVIGQPPGFRRSIEFFLPTVGAQNPTADRRPRPEEMRDPVLTRHCPVLRRLNLGGEHKSSCSHLIKLNQYAFERQTVSVPEEINELREVLESVSPRKCVFGKHDARTCPIAVVEKYAFVG